MRCHNLKSIECTFTPTHILPIFPTLIITSKFSAYKTTIPTTFTSTIQSVTNHMPFSCTVLLAD
jgi:hypothetical protein